MDTGASVLVRLKNKAKESGKPLQLHLQLFCQEEFLRRLCMSSYADNLVLKGGMLIYILTKFESRATVDIDFLLRQLPNGVEDIKKIIDEILAVNTGNDFIELTAKSFETISPQRKYNGVSFQLIGQIKNTKTPFNIDLGVGDVIVPKAQSQIIPVQLENFVAPTVVAYSLESTIAEKFDAMLQRLELTSRMKDFYDIFYLSQLFSFDGRQLQQAIYETLSNRGTSYERDSFDKVIGLRKDAELQVRWRQYLRRAKLPELAFDKALSGIDIFLRPVWNAVIEENELLKTWNPRNESWSDS